MSKGLAIVLYSGRADSFVVAGVLSQTAVNLDMPVRIFATSFAVPYFMKDKPEPRIPSEFSDLAPKMLEGMAKMKAPSWYDMLKNAKELGDVKVIVCSLMMEVWGFSKDQLDPIVDEVVGAAAFLSEVSDYQVIFV